MSLIIPLTIKFGGVARDADETPLLTDADGLFGIKRADTGEIIVRAGEPFTRSGVGSYAFELADPIAGVTYIYARRLLLNGNTQHKTASVLATAVNVLPSYMTLAEADAMAASLPKLDAYKAADANGRQQLLAGATMRVDASRRWQGRKYHLDQVLEFPRIPHPRYLPLQNGYVQPVSPSYTRVWDWDAINKTAVVPARVKLAVLYEADAMGDGERDRIIAAVSAGLTAQNTGSLSEQYRQMNAGQMNVAALCPQADNLVRGYRIVTGELR